MITKNLKDGPITYDHSRNMVFFAANCLVKYFELFGAKRPGEMEDDFCGKPGLFEMMSNIQGRWRASPFYPALGHLVDMDIVYYWTDDTGDVWYDVKATSKPLEIDAHSSRVSA